MEHNKAAIKIGPDALEKRLDRIISWIKTCDNKASILLSINALALTLLLSNDTILDGLKRILTTVGVKGNICVDFLGFTAFLFCLFSILLLVTSLYFCIAVLFAKTDEGLTHCANVKKDSLIHFHHIAEVGFDKFINEIDNQDSQSYMDDLKSQIFINAFRCDEKYKYYNIAVRTLKWAIPFIVLFIFLVLIYISR